MNFRSILIKKTGPFHDYEKNSVYMFLLFLMFGMSFLITDTLIFDYCMQVWTETGIFVTYNNAATASEYALFVRMLVFSACIAAGLLVSAHINREGRAQSALEVSEKRFRTISERISDLIFILDGDLNILYANPAVKNVLGYENFEITGKKPYCKVHSDDLEILRNEKENLLNGNGGRRVRLRIQGRDKSFSIIEFSGFCDQGSEKKMYYLIGKDITADIESRKCEKAAIEQINKNLNQLAVLNDHIRNPLTVIVAYADVLQGSESEAIIEQAYAIDNIIRRLDIGWVESAKIREFLIKHYNIAKEV